MQADIESIQLAEIIKLGQTGIIKAEQLSALGALMDSLKGRAEQIADAQEGLTRASHDGYIDHYVADDEWIVITADGFEVQMSYSDRCGGGTQFETQTVSFEDYLNPDILPQLEQETTDATKRTARRKTQQAAARKTAAAKATTDAEEFRLWKLQQNGKK